MTEAACTQCESDSHSVNTNERYEQQLGGNKEGCGKRHFGVLFRKWGRSDSAAEIRSLFHKKKLFVSLSLRVREEKDKLSRKTTKRFPSLRWTDLFGRSTTNDKRKSPVSFLVSPATFFTRGSVSKPSRVCFGWGLKKKQDERKRVRKKKGKSFPQARGIFVFEAEETHNFRYRRHFFRFPGQTFDRNKWIGKFFTKRQLIFLFAKVPERPQFFFVLHSIYVLWADRQILYRTRTKIAEQKKNITRPFLLSP